VRLLGAKTEIPDQSVQPSFNPSLKVDFQGSRVISDSDKTGWEGRGLQLGTRIATVWNPVPSLGPGQEK
jgi:hypothetical protein